MTKHSIEVSNCSEGEILAEDIVLDGVKLVAKNTILNSYIFNKLLSYSIFKIIIYNKDESGNLKLIKDKAYETIKSSYRLSVNGIKHIINEIVSKDNLDFQTLNQLSSLIIDLSECGSDVIIHLNSLKQSDEYTYTHCVNVSLYALLIGKWMSLSNDKLREIAQAGLLHDIGKLKIAEKILKKPNNLTKNEFHEIKNHTIYGYDIANSNKDISLKVKKAILMHHERMDGSGYPFGLVDKDISLYSRIISVADAYDAMTSDRVYKIGTNPFQAFKMLLTEGIRLFDTGVIFTMIENLSAYYTGMKVMLDTGEIGEIVYVPPKNISSPIIKTSERFIDFSKEDISSIINIL